MTAYAISFEKTQATIASDTLCYVPNRQEARPLGFMSKVFVVPHLKCAILTRGIMQISAVAATRLNLSPQVRTIEDAAAVLPEMLMAETQRWADEQEIADPASLAIAEVALLGWSEAERRMVMYYGLNRDDYALQSDNGEHYGLLSFPRLPEHDMPKPAGNVDKQLVDIMLAEKKFFAAHPELMGGMILGGEVQAWTIEPAGISQRIIHKFEDYAQSAHAGAAITARILRGHEHVDVESGLVPLNEAKTADDMSTPATSRQERRAAERAARKGRRAAA